MMTPQEVASCTFTKAVMGGYNMAAVDDFLDKLTEDYAALYEDNTALKAKLKVLADKLEEYRSMEDTMRSTLLTAQKMANSLVAEAEAKRDALISDVADSAKRRVAELQQEIAAEEQRLVQVRAEVDQQIAAEEQRLAMSQNALRGYIQTVESVCRQQLDLLEKLPKLPIEPTEPAGVAAMAAVPVQPTPSSVASVEASQPVQQPEGPSASASVEPVAELAAVSAAETPAPDAEAADVSSIAKDIENVFAVFATAETAEQNGSAMTDPFHSDPFAEEEEDVDMASTRKINLDELQFGRNYQRG